MKKTSAFAEKPITELAAEEDGTGRLRIRKVELVVEWAQADLDGWFGLMLNGCKKSFLDSADVKKAGPTGRVSDQISWCRRCP